MKLAWFSLVGVVLQGFFLVAFILISRSPVAGPGKPVVVLLALLSVALLLWHGVRRTADVRSLWLLPVVLAVGYVVAFHVVGALGFPGLLSSLDAPFGAYLWSVLRVTVALLVPYGIATALLAVVSRALQRRR